MKIALKLRISSCVGGFTNGLPVVLRAVQSEVALKAINIISI
jgi:hypothetical protein